MRKLALVLLFLSFAQISEARDPGPEDESYFAFIGAGLGRSWLSTNILSDNGDKNGSVKNFNLSATYYDTSWIASLRLGYYELYVENDPGPLYTKLITETFYLDFNPEYRITNRWSFGMSYQHLLGEEYLAGPTSVVNANDENTSQSLGGITVHYDIPFKESRIRTGFSAHKALSLGNRSAYIALFSIQIGVPFYKRNQEEKVVYRDREVIKTVPAEIIVFGEQLINFKTNSYALTDRSSKLVDKIGELFKQHLTSWDIVRVVGHTDIIGDSIYNQHLSEKRAESVKNLFIKNGLSRERVFFLGFGESRLRDSNTTKEAHTINRRVELHFIGHLNKEFAQKLKEFVAKENLKQETKSP
jgi:outer membrane protein OmpA-like peptidoglycan-associated protein